jgi:hypothetical protein
MPVFCILDYVNAFIYIYLACSIAAANSRSRLPRTSVPEGRGTQSWRWMAAGVNPTLRSLRPIQRCPSVWFRTDPSFHSGMIFNALPLTRALFACFCMFSVPALPAVQGHGSDTAATFLQRCRLRTPNARPVCQTCLHTETKQLCLNTQQIDKFDEAVHTVFLFMPCAPYALCMLQPQPSANVPKQPPQGKIQRYMYIYISIDRKTNIIYIIYTVTNWPYDAQRHFCSTQ